jgi:hypothetical protein
MFNRHDLEELTKEQLTHWQIVAAYPGLYYATYPSSAFETSSSEECIRVTRAQKSPNENGLRFWLTSEWLDDWKGREKYFPDYVFGAQFEKISEAEFNKLVAEQSHQLSAPLKQPIHEPNGFVGAMMMYSMKTDFIVSIFAEYEEEFIHFYWSTTA